MGRATVCCGLPRWQAIKSAGIGPGPTRGMAPTGQRHPAQLVRQYAASYGGRRECSWRPLSLLTHWGREKMAAIFQMTFSIGFSWMKMYDQATSHYLNQWGLDYQRIYASLGLNELRDCSSVVIYANCSSTLCNVNIRINSTSINTGSDYID